MGQDLGFIFSRVPKSVKYFLVLENIIHTLLEFIPKNSSFPFSIHPLSRHFTIVNTSGRKEKMKEGSQEARLPREENRLVDGNEDKTSWPPRFDRRGVDRSEGGGQVDSTRRGRALSPSRIINRPTYLR